MIKITTYGEVTRIDLARTVAGRGRYWTTCYHLADTLIDSGCAHTAPELVQYMADKPLQRIINTHTHEDHIGANGALQRRKPRLEILAHSEAIPILHDPRKTQPLLPYRRFFWGWPEPSQARPLRNGQAIAVGDHRLQVIDTPGHSRDHICLYEPERGWVFSGDLFVGGRDRALRQGYDIWGVIESLKKIAALPHTRLYPGSARVPDDPQAALQVKIEHLETLGAQVLELHQKGLSVSQIARRLMGRPMWVEFVTLGHFSRRWLVRSYLGQFAPRQASP